MAVDFEPPIRVEAESLALPIDYGIARESKIESLDVDNASDVFYRLLRTTFKHWNRSMNAWDSFSDVMKWNRHKMELTEIVRIADPIRTDLELNLERTWRSFDIASEVLLRTLYNRPTTEELADSRTVLKQRHYFYKMANAWTLCLDVISTELAERPPLYGHLSDVPPGTHLLWPWYTMARRYCNRKRLMQEFGLESADFWASRQERAEAGSCRINNETYNEEDEEMPDSPSGQDQWTTQNAYTGPSGSSYNLTRRLPNLALSTRIQYVICSHHPNALPSPLTGHVHNIYSVSCTNRYLKTCRARRR